MCPTLPTPLSQYQVSIKPHLPSPCSFSFFFRSGRPASPRPAPGARSYGPAKRPAVRHPRNSQRSMAGAPLHWMAGATHNEHRVMKQDGAHEPECKHICQSTVYRKRHSRLDYLFHTPVRCWTSCAEESTTKAACAGDFTTKLRLRHEGS